MLGYDVTLTSGSVETIEADRYEVAEDASVVFYGGGREVARVQAGAWVEIHEVGRRLAESWPPPRLCSVLEAVASRLGVHYGHYVHGLVDPSAFGDWRLNDLDTLTDAIFTAIAADPEAGTSRSEVADTRQLILDALDPIDEAPPGP
jgi:hypothetical protein